MNRRQIKHHREFHENQIDRLMSKGYAGSNDPAFIKACFVCGIHEKELKRLAAASNEINAKAMVTRAKKKMAKYPQLGEIPF